MDFSLCGWRVSSELRFHELLPWTGDDRPADITIRFGPVPTPTSGEWRGGPLLQVRTDGACRFALDKIGSYLITGGREIVIDPVVAHDTPDLSLFLLGTCFGVLCHQRGLLPLHASCVTFGDGAVAFAGESGAGKSTIAAILLRHGARLVSDDVTVIDTQAPGGPVVLPSFPRQKLWRDTLTALDIPPGSPLRTTAALEKFDQRVGEDFHAAPIRLSKIISVYRFKTFKEAGLSPVHGIKAFDLLQEHIYRFRAANLLGLGNQLFAHTAALAAQVPQAKLVCRLGLPSLVEQIRDLPALLSGGRP